MSGPVDTTKAAEPGIITIQLGVVSQYVMADYTADPEDRDVRRAAAVLTVQARDDLAVSTIVDHIIRHDGHVIRTSPDTPTWVWSDDDLVSATLARHYGIEQKAERQDEAAMTEVTPEEERAAAELEARQAAAVRTFPGAVVTPADQVSREDDRL